MINAWWFNNRQKEENILQPDFFIPKTHFRLFAELPNIQLPIEIVISAMVSGVRVYEKSFVIDDLATEKSFELHIDINNGTIMLRDLANTLEKDPDQLNIEICTGGNVYTANINCEYATIYGKITDFYGIPFPAAVSFSRTAFEGFEDNFGVWSDVNGEYSITVPKGNYNAIYVADRSYGKTSLENWSWNMIVDRDEEHNFKIGNAEVYSLSAWTDNGGFPILFVFFRPMTFPQIKTNEYCVKINGIDYPVLDISPDIDINDLTVKINGCVMKNISLQKIIETNKERSMVAYILQIERYAENYSTAGKQTLILEYDSKINANDSQSLKIQSQGRTQFFYTNANALALR